MMKIALLAASVVAAPLELHLNHPADVLEPSSIQGRPIIRHPWPIRKSNADEVNVEEKSRSSRATLDITVEDGVEVGISVSPQVLPFGQEVAIYLALFSTSFIGPEDSVEKWMSDAGLPPQHHPLRLSTLFHHQFAGVVKPDDLGDACTGEALILELCAHVLTCLLAVGGSNGGGYWRVALPVRHASNFRLEVHLSASTPACPVVGVADQHLERKLYSQNSWWAPPIAEHAVALTMGNMDAASFLDFQVLHLSKASFWWSVAAQVESMPSWAQAMRAAIISTQLHQQLGSNVPVSSQGLWLEFGVGSGRSTTFISWQMKLLLGEAVMLHGFDSFQGLPSTWTQTNLGAGTFSMGGRIPEHLAQLSNVRLHVGLFSETLDDLDAFDSAPVAFVHIDVDLYASAVEVLTRIACQLVAGAVIVFDEFVNYPGFEASGEFVAWQYITSLYKISWSYAGFFWQQAVPIVITGRGRVC